jgi:hypothetical protein
MDVDHAVEPARPTARRRARRFVAGGAIVAASVVGSVAMLVTSYTGAADRVEDFARITSVTTAPSSSTNPAAPRSTTSTPAPPPTRSTVPHPT